MIWGPGQAEADQAVSLTLRQNIADQHEQRPEEYGQELIAREGAEEAFAPQGEHGVIEEHTLYAA